MPSVSHPLDSDVQGMATHATDNGHRHGPAPDSRILLLPEGDSGNSCACTIIRFSRGETHLRTHRRVEAATNAVLRIDGVSISGMISYCVLETDGYLTCFATGPADGRGRRGSDRRPADAPCMIIAPAMPGAGWVSGRIADYSLFGLGLKSALQLNAGTTVCVKTDTMMIAGVVRHYRRCEDGGVHTGLDVTDVLMDAAPSEPDGTESLIDKIRRRIAEFIVGRPIEPAAASEHPIPWGFSGPFQRRTNDTEE